MGQSDQSLYIVDRTEDWLAMKPSLVPVLISLVSEHDDITMFKTQFPFICWSKVVQNSAAGLIPWGSWEFPYGRSFHWVECCLQLKTRLICGLGWYSPVGWDEAYLILSSSLGITCCRIWTVHLQYSSWSWKSAESWLACWTCLTQQLLETQQISLNPHRALHWESCLVVSSYNQSPGFNL